MNEYVTDPKPLGEPYTIFHERRRKRFRWVLFLLSLDRKFAGTQTATAPAFGAFTKRNVKLRVRRTSQLNLRLELDTKFSTSPLVIENLARNRGDERLGEVSSVIRRRERVRGRFGGMPSCCRLESGPCSALIRHDSFRAVRANIGSFSADTA